MIERGEHLRFTAEAGDALGIVGERRGQDLQRDVTSELGVLCSVDFTHAAGTDGLQDLVQSRALSGNPGS